MAWERCKRPRQTERESAWFSTHFIVIGGIPTGVLLSNAITLKCCDVVVGVVVAGVFWFWHVCYLEIQIDRYRQSYVKLVRYEWHINLERCLQMCNPEAYFENSGAQFHIFDSFKQPSSRTQAQTSTQSQFGNWHTQFSGR